jgi:hypothetical protein
VCTFCLLINAQEKIVADSYWERGVKGPITTISPAHFPPTSFQGPLNRDSGGAVQLPSRRVHGRSLAGAADKSRCDAMYSSLSWSKQVLSFISDQ